ncbi:crotonase/enoyl-CoA hydratase family protein [Erythrobacter litoralis]|uniref:Enoyl-CoA hydratase/isomerase family protein n=1 Tax=Erythrobacter litoralis (strain HTCC2594) TaxID=314225 RepID=Q2NAJ4_ERYLH|nr:crotonase/enoyl-CoA hydratase family protein [Erythrobacter litoralis]ABC63297.1 enoyl-CoA hydratase/isomerase family protein [Erythrobacter litoralis HTCC2594]
MIETTELGAAIHARMDDGKVNDISMPMLDRLQEVLGKAAAKQQPVVLEGKPGLFSAGFDLKTFAKGADAALKLLQAGQDAILAILRHPAPVVTICTGNAFPAGAFLMMASDRAIGIRGDFKIGMNETMIGLVLPAYSIALATRRLAPSGRKAIGTGMMFDPEEALRVGYLDKLVDPGDLDAERAALPAFFEGMKLPAFAGNKAQVNAEVIAAIEATELPKL